MRAVGMQRRQVFKVAGVGDFFGIFAVDGFDAQQREVTLGFLGRTNLALNDMAIAQAKSADLARADVDVVGAGKIIEFGGAEEAEAVGEDFQDAFAVHQAVLADAAAEDLEDHILLFHADVVLNSFGTSDLVQGQDVHLLKVFDVELAALDLLIFGIGLGVEIGDVIAAAAIVARIIAAFAIASIVMPAILLPRLSRLSRPPPRLSWRWGRS